MLKHDCPSNEMLREYLQGWLSDDQQQELDRHLTDCDDCDREILQLESNFSDFFPGLANRINRQISSQSSRDNDRLDEHSIVNKALLEIKEWPSTKSSLQSQLDSSEQIGQYQIIRRIGAGGMAQIFLARHCKLKRLFAIKVLNVSKNHLEESLLRLEREIKVIGKLQHNSIVAATDAGTHQRHPYLVTEYVDGLDLNQLARRLAEHKIEIQTADACELIRQACLGFSYAHAQGVIHRDVKPSNLMLGISGHVKILDFGLAHLQTWQEQSLELTSVGQLLGTLDYMAPEQADNIAAVDQRADIYALGATLFRLLSGRAPYASSQQQSPLEKLRLLANSEPPRLKTLRTDLPEELCSIVDRSLNRNPQLRPNCAAILAELLEPFTKNSDLASLIATTKKLPEPRKEADAERLFSDLSSSRKTETPPGSQPPNWRLWLVTILAFSGFVTCAIILFLETHKGQLIIQSEKANVTVRLLKEGRTYKEMEVHPGSNSTRLFAGKYEIEIDGAGDQFELTESNFELLRQGVKIASIREIPKQIEAEFDEPDKPDTPAASIREGFAINVFTLNGEGKDYKKIVLSVFNDVSVDLNKNDTEAEQLVCIGPKDSVVKITSLINYLEGPPSESPFPLPNDRMILKVSANGLTTTAIHQLLLSIADPGRWRITSSDKRHILTGTTKDVQKLLPLLAEMQTKLLPSQKAINDGSISPTKATTQGEEIKNLSGQSSIPTAGIYEGKTFDHWRAIFKFELSAKSRVEAMHAMSQFQTDREKEILTEVFLEYVSESPRIDLEVLGVSQPQKLSSNQITNLINSLNRMEPQRAVSRLRSIILRSDKASSDYCISILDATEQYLGSNPDLPHEQLTRIAESIDKHYSQPPLPSDEIKSKVLELIDSPVFSDRFLIDSLPASLRWHDFSTRTTSLITEKIPQSIDKLQPESISLLQSLMENAQHVSNKEARIKVIQNLNQMLLNTRLETLLDAPLFPYYSDSFRETLGVSGSNGIFHTNDHARMLSSKDMSKTFMLYPLSQDKLGAPLLLESQHVNFSMFSLELIARLLDKDTTLQLNGVQHVIESTDTYKIRFWNSVAGETDRRSKRMYVRGYAFRLGDYGTIPNFKKLHELNPDDERALIGAVLNRIATQVLEKSRP